jgi:hypothetical protein
MVMGVPQISWFFRGIEARQGIILGKLAKTDMVKRTRKPDFGHIFIR